MTNIRTVRSNLLDHFYEHLTDRDWLEGVDLYQAGKVSSIRRFEGLVLAKVVSPSHPGAEVRIKVHPNGKVIQWIECICRKNRALNHYCEHIAALMIHIDREMPDLFAGLDVKMPLKPPTVPRRLRSDTDEKDEDKDGDPADKGAAQTLIKHLSGSIQSVSLIAHGPSLRVRIEIKPGQLTFYDLDLDGTAKFLASRTDLPNATAEVKALTVFPQTAMLGTRIYQVEDEKIATERVVAIPVVKAAKQKDKPDSLGRITTVTGKYKLIDGSATASQESTWEFIPIKAASKYIGEQHLFLPGRGFWPINKGSVNAGWSDLPLSKIYKDDDAARFAGSGFADYASLGPIWLDEHLQDSEIVELPKLSQIRIHDEQAGWFRLDPRYGDGKGAVSMASMMQQYRSKKRKFLRSGKLWYKVPEFITEHDWQLDDDEQFLKVDALGLMRFKAAVGDFDNFAGSKAMLNKIRDKLEFSDNSEVPDWANDRLNLRQYQATGVQWLWWLYSNKMHGLLADEMGLGKTHQAMALMCAIQKSKPGAKFVVICPTTVLDHWFDKVEQFAPNLRPLIYHGPHRGLSFHRMAKDRDLMITSYGVLLRDIKQLGDYPWETVILDEAHLVKNNATSTYKAACRIKAGIRICLTGTPLENHLGELKNLFDFLLPGYLGSDEYFRRTYMQPIKKGDDPQREVALQRLIHPFKLRRTKENVLTDLPAKVEDLRHCSLSEEQIKHYREVIDLKAAPLIKQLKENGTPVPFLHVFATLTLLKQICNHPALLVGPDKYTKHHSGKFELAKELIDEALGSGHKVVIYSQYVDMIKILSLHLEHSGIDHAVLTGQTRNRGEVIARFQTDPNCKIFLGSLLAGGIGIDLTAASVVIHYDRWWNASKENQATDRVHRIGQNKNVQVMKLVTRGTLEEKIDKMIQAKQAIFERFMDRDEEMFKNFSRDELIQLLE